MFPVQLWLLEANQSKHSMIGSLIRPDCHGAVQGDRQTDRQADGRIEKEMDTSALSRSLCLTFSPSLFQTAKVDRLQDIWLSFAVTGRPPRTLAKCTAESQLSPIRVIQTQLTPPTRATKQKYLNK